MCSSDLDRIQRAGHVRAGVAIGDRVDVQAVDARGVLTHRVPKGHDRAPQPIGVETLVRPLGGLNWWVHPSDGSGRG